MCAGVAFGFHQMAYLYPPQSDHISRNYLRLESYCSDSLRVFQMNHVMLVLCNPFRPSHVAQGFTQHKKERQGILLVILFLQLVLICFVEVSFSHYVLYIYLARQQKSPMARCRYCSTHVQVVRVSKLYLQYDGSSIWDFRSPPGPPRCFKMSKLEDTCAIWKTRWQICHIAIESTIGRSIKDVSMLGT